MHLANDVHFHLPFIGIAFFASLSTNFAEHQQQKSFLFNDLDFPSAGDQLDNF